MKDSINNICLRIENGAFEGELSSKQTVLAIIQVSTPPFLFLSGKLSKDFDFYNEAVKI